jgi:hypothetical protein
MFKAPESREHWQDGQNGQHQRLHRRGLAPNKPNKTPLDVPIGISGTQSQAQSRFQTGTLIVEVADAPCPNGSHINIRDTIFS